MTHPSLLVASLLVASGGGTGALARFHLGRLVQRLAPAAQAGFPWATLIANVLGSLLMGLLVGYLARHGSSKESWRLLIGVGLLGGFTTFSSFSMEIVLLWERGAFASAIAYAAVSLAAGVAAMVLGLMVMRVAG